jgi:hypothetical protein
MAIFPSFGLHGLARIDPSYSHKDTLINVCSELLAEKDYDITTRGLFKSCIVALKPRGNELPVQMAVTN